MLGSTLRTIQQTGLGTTLRTVLVVGCCAVAAGAGGALPEPARAGGADLGPATATPGPAVRATTLAAGASPARFEIPPPPGPTDLSVVVITIEPGGSTGWHTHAGPLLAVVHAGTLTRQLADCSVVTTAAGQAFVEPDGAQHPHVGWNLGPEPVVLYITAVLPAGSPLSVEASNPGCGR